MKPRAHSSLLLLITLIIGMLLGALIHSNIRSSRMKHMSIMHSEEKFVQSIETAIIPTDEDQAEKIRAILSDSAPRIIGTIRDSRTKVRAELETMQGQLFPMLDEEQQERLKERLKPRKRSGSKKD